MTHIRAIKSVYCYYFPETRKIIDEVIKQFPHDLLLQSVFPGLDNFHEPLIEKYVKLSGKYQKGLENFTNRYFCNGSSEAIFHLIAKHIINHPSNPIYVLRGEYEGYKEYTKNLGGIVVEVDNDIDIIRRLNPGLWFISNPSAIDGNLHPNSLIKSICDLGHQVIVDLAYLGLTRQYRIDLAHPNIIAVVASMSKPYGLFYYRVGFAFTRNPMPTLYPNIWFKNILSVVIAEKILDNFGFGYLYRKYLPSQKKAIMELNKEANTKVIASDILILANLPAKDTSSSPESISQYKRGSNYRFCLTPYFLSGRHNNL